MIDLEYLRKNPKRVQEVARARGASVSVEDALILDRKLQTLRQSLESSRADRNRASQAMAGFTPAEREKKRGDLKSLGDRVSTLQKDFDECAAAFQELLLQIPNLVLEDVALDPNPEHNIVLREVGDKPSFAFPVRDHLAIGEALDAIDVERATKVSGPRFVYLKGILAELEFALIQLTLQIVRRHQFIPIIPPVMVKDEVVRGVGYLEAGGTLERYHLDKDGLYLVGSSEQSIVPIHLNETLAASQLPRRYLGFSTCFRREAGAYGKDTRGMFRIHQFDKLEMVSFVLPDQGEEEHRLLLSIEEEIVQQLGLPYRVLRLVSGDIAFPLARTFDIEVWLPSQQAYRETHSCSTATDFQARRLNIRYQRGREKGLVHTLNATAVTGRLLIAIMENYQTEKGFRIPAALVPYVGREAVEA